MDKQKIVTIFYTDTEWKGDLIVQHLRTEGIPAHLVNRTSATLLGGLANVELEILVPEEMAQKAKELIDLVLAKNAEIDEENMAQGEENDGQ